MNLLERIPAVTANQMAAVDRLMTGDYGINLLQMMEHAGLGTAMLACRAFLDDPSGKRIMVLAGSGGNGGGALATARLLSNRGADVSCVVAATPDRLKPATRHQWTILERMAVSLTPAGTFDTGAPAPALVVDGLIGYSLNGAPGRNHAELIRWANGVDAPVLSIDLPSGIDATTGEVFEPAVRADATLTLALPKTGLLSEGAAEFTGELYLGDIGVPPGLYSRLGIGTPPAGLFATDSVIRLR